MNSSPCTITCHQYRAESRYQKTELGDGSVTENEVWHGKIQGHVLD